MDGLGQQDTHMNAILPTRLHFFFFFCAGPVACITGPLTAFLVGAHGSRGVHFAQWATVGMELFCVRARVSGTVVALVFVVALSFWKGLNK